ILVSNLRVRVKVYRSVGPGAKRDCFQPASAQLLTRLPVAYARGSVVTTNPDFDSSRCSTVVPSAPGSSVLARALLRSDDLASPVRPVSACPCAYPDRRLW